MTYLTVSIPGLGALRERNVRVCDMPGYSRETFISAVIESLRVVTDSFPGKTVTIGFWKLTDTRHDPELWQEVRTAIIEKLNRRVGFFMENLAASRDATGKVTGFPNTDFAAPLYLSRNDVPIYFQALTCWKRPFTGQRKVKGALPIDGIRYAEETFNAKYFELYVPDLLDAKYASGLAEWAARNGPPPDE